MTRRKRFLLIASAAAVAGLASGPVLRPILIRAAADRARRQVIARAESALGASLEVGRVDVSIMPTVVVLNDLRLEKDAAFGLRAGSSLDRLTVSGDPRALARWGSRPVRLDAERPDVRIVLPGAGAKETQPAAPVQGRAGRHGAAFPA